MARRCTQKTCDYSSQPLLECPGIGRGFAFVQLLEGKKIYDAWTGISGTSKMEVEKAPAELANPIHARLQYGDADRTRLNRMVDDVFKMVAADSADER